jgi:hypothetical protein
MLESGSSGCVSIQDYYGLSAGQMELVFPELPGIYVWTFDFLSLLGRPAEQVRDALKCFLAQEGVPRRGKSTDHSIRISWNHVRKDLELERLEALVVEISEVSDLGQVIAKSATRFQRPLYVGIASNLKNRIESHLKGDSSDLLKRIDAINIRDCAVEWAVFDNAVAYQPPVAGEGGPRALLASSQEEDEGTEEITLPHLLRSFESLLIRTAQPLLNVLPDS